MVKQRTYTDRLVVSTKLRKLIETKAYEELRRVKPEMVNVRITHEIILISMLKYYLGHDYYNKPNNEHNTEVRDK